MSAPALVYFMDWGVIQQAVCVCVCWHVSTLPEYFIFTGTLLIFSASPHMHTAGYFNNPTDSNRAVHLNMCVCVWFFNQRLPSCIFVLTTLRHVFIVFNCEMLLIEGTYYMSICVLTKTQMCVHILHKHYHSDLGQSVCVLYRLLQRD